MGFRFLPRGFNFFDLFDKQVEYAIEAAVLFKEIASRGEVDAGSHIKMEEIEHKGDETTHSIIENLNKTFITPFDREDIHYLASSLDDIADYIYACAKKINFYRVDPIDHGLHRFAELIYLSTEQVRNAVKELRNMKNLRVMTEALVKINSIENQADDLFDHSIERLFAEEPDAKEVMKLREIYQVMEIATDKCEDAGNVIESIIIKYA